jgi:putative redox protein
MSDEWREITAEWAGEGQSGFWGRNEAGGVVQMMTVNDQPGLSPMELVLAAVAGCTGVDIVNILEKKRQNLDKLEVKVRGKRASDTPKIYTDIEITYHVWGDVQPNALAQAIQLSEEKYCTVSLMLRPKVNISACYVLHMSDGQVISAGV